MNEKLIKDMLKCDGTRLNCAGCTFEDNPECRNAMAHHAGALIQLQDVVIENQAKTIAGKKKELREQKDELRKVCEKLTGLDRIASAVLNDLKERRDCQSCGWQGAENNTETCEKCRTKSEWMIAERFLKKGEEDDDWDGDSWEEEEESRGESAVKEIR